MNPRSKPSILIIGGGKAGSSFAHHFLKNKIKIVSLVENDPHRSQFLQDELAWKFIRHQVDSNHFNEAGIILIAVQDTHIGELTHRLAKVSDVWSGKTVLHLSGTLPSTLLHPLATRGALTGSLHPIFSFDADPRENPHFRQCWFTLEGNQISPRDLEGNLAIKKDRIIPLDSAQKKAIHIASVFYANFFIALADMGLEILNKSEALSSEKLPLLKPLILSTIENLTKRGPAQALTGPVSRGDIDTLRHHLKFLEKNHPNLKEAYQLLGKRLVMLSKLSKKEKEEIIDLLYFS
jgi:predicted short-subunit dehydrogenase-like oxidoreductase (DUF2520 family)